MGLEIDYMEYATDATAQAAYVTNATTGNVYISQTTYDTDNYLGDNANVEYRRAQSFQLSAAQTISAVEFEILALVGSPSGNWTVKIETDNAGKPSGTLANASATISYTPGAAGYKVITFASSFTLSAATLYWIVLLCDNQSTNVRWNLRDNSTDVYADGSEAESTNGGSTWSNSTRDLWFKVYTLPLQSFSEATIKTQGSYALKGVAAQGLPISNADIDDEDMADIADWSDEDSGTGDSSQVTFDSKSCMKLNTGASNGSSSERKQDIGTFGARSVFSFSTYIEDVGTSANSDIFTPSIHNGTYSLNLTFASDGLFIYNSATNVEVGNNLVIVDTWQEWTFDINWTTARVNVYLNGALVGSNIDCSLASATANGTVRLQAYRSTALVLVYINWFKAGSDIVYTSTLGSYDKTLTRTF